MPLRSTMSSSSQSQVITCKAAICWGVGKPVMVEEIQVDPPKATEVRVKMLCASICHTDISSTQGFPHNKFPLALGHEGVGAVESVGDQVTNLKEGDMVIPTYIGECKECENCVSGKTNLCVTYPIRLTGLMPDNTSRMSIQGQSLHHVLSCSTWSEYVVMDVNYLLKVDSSIDLAHASFISCGFSTGFGAAWKEAKVESGSSVAIFGLGAVGLGAISGAKMQGATQIIGIDINEMKREKGTAFGMTHFINPGDSSVKSTSELIKELTNGMGVDYSFECTGVAPLLTQSVEATKVGVGKTIAIGTGTQTIVPLDLLALLFGRTLKGCAFGGIKTISDLSIIADKCQKEVKVLFSSLPRTRIFIYPKVNSEKLRALLPSWVLLFLSCFFPTLAEVALPPQLAEPKQQRNSLLKRGRTTSRRRSSLFPFHASLLYCPNTRHFTIHQWKAKFISIDMQLLRL